MTESGDGAPASLQRPEGIPSSLWQTVVNMTGQQGAEWLHSIPAILAECAKQWDLTVGPPFVGLSFNYVAPAMRADGTPVVLKVCSPNYEFATEVEALRVYGGRGAVQVLDVDMERGAILLERLLPGTMLVDVEDVEATSMAATIMKQIWHPVPAAHHFPTVADWATGFERLRAQFGGTSGPFPAQLVIRAERLYAELLASAAPSVVLHGDLHHYNILSATREPWLAIDPKGVIGEPVYETGAWLRNPIGIAKWPNVKRITARRIAQLSEELGFEQERIHAWAVAQTVLSAWWSYEDHHEWREPIVFAQTLAEVKV